MSNQNATGASMPAFPIGLYVGNPGDANFKPNFDLFKATFGVTPTVMNVFLDRSQSPSQWTSNMQYMAGAWASTGAAYVGPTSGVLPLLGIPLAPNSAAGANLDPFLKAVAAGTYDTIYQSLVDAWAAQGYPAIDIRLSYEFNCSFMQDDPDTGTGSTIYADWMAAWNRIAALLKARGTAKNIRVRMIWNPADVNWSKTDPHALYPGDANVDIIGTDAYSPVFQPGTLANYGPDYKPDGTTSATYAAWLAIPNNRRWFWSYGNGNQWNPNPMAGAGWNIFEAIDMAKKHGKLFAICETGAGGDGKTLGPVDEDAFAPWLLSVCQYAQSQGVPPQYVSSWATTQGDGAWGFMDIPGYVNPQPKAKAAWQAAFGNMIPIQVLLNGVVVYTGMQPGGQKNTASIVTG